MTWNLRVVKMQENDEDYFEIREVYYDEMGKPFGHCTATIGGENIEDLRTYLKLALEALEKRTVNF